VLHWLLRGTWSWEHFGALSGGCPSDRGTDSGDCWETRCAGKTANMQPNGEKTHLCFVPIFWQTRFTTSDFLCKKKSLNVAGITLWNNASKLDNVLWPTYQDNFVCLDCVGAVVAAESNVEELWRLTQLAKTRADVRFEIVPPEKKRLKNTVRISF